MAISIKKNTGYHNTTYRRNRSIQYIVIHYTAGTSSRAGSAFNTCEWFKNKNAGGSADYCVDDTSIYQYNPDPNNYYCWAVGGGKYSSMTTSVGGKFYKKCLNTNSISIEMCSNKRNTSNLSDMANDWYFTEATIFNTVELTKFLMKKYNVPIDHIIMHHHVTGKICPSPWVRNESALKGWNDFITRVKGQNTETEKQPDVIDTICKIAINGNIKEYKTKNVKGLNYITARAFLEDLGYIVGFNDIKKRVMVDNRLTLDVSTIIENGSSFIHLRETIDFLNKYDNFHFLQDKSIRYDANTGVIVIS